MLRPMNTPIKKIQLVVAGVGILVPYLSRIPGVFFKSSTWLTSFLSVGIGGTLFLQTFNAVCWGAIVCAIGTYKNARSVFFPILAGFPLLVFWYAYLDLASSSTAALALIFIPIETLPPIFVGWLIGKYFDRTPNTI
jgi:hypothetical protein